MSEYRSGHGDYVNPRSARVPRPALDLNVERREVVAQRWADRLRPLVDKDPRIKFVAVSARRRNEANTGPRQGRTVDRGKSAR